MTQDYKIIRKLAAGGFAEVFLGTAEGVEGFSKTVAIKRILPNLTEHSEEKERFVRMFLDEAHLWSQLNHNNIVQVFDLGTGIDNNDSFFIVMEFIDGANLEIIMRAARKRGFKIPIHHSVFITMQICEGLHHAHMCKDNQTHEPLNVVHRDISPPNIIMTLDGHVKITDFGLAKATTQLEKTNPNSLKGKIDYMSPEQAKGEDLDHRTDIFATGILLYEMLSNKKLYPNKPTRETLDIVQTANIAPIRTLNPDVHPDLEKILIKALQPDPDKRYQTCLELEDDLAVFLFKHDLKVITHDIAESLKMAFSYKKKIDEDNLAKMDTIDQLIVNALIRVNSVKNKDDLASILNKNNTNVADADKPLTVFYEEDELSTVSPLLNDGRGHKGSSWMMIIIVLIILALLGVATTLFLNMI